MVKADFTLPGILAEIAEAAGPIAALRLAEAKGGTRAYIPMVERLHAEHWLVIAVGLAAAQKISGSFGGGEVEIPHTPMTSSRAQVWKRINDGLQAGLTEAEIARCAGVNHRTVRRHKSGDTAAAGSLRRDQNTLF